VNINKLKPCTYLGKVPKQLEVTVEHGLENKEDSEHKEDSQKYFWYGSTKNQTTQKTIVN
jgi:hypothetical protein